MKTGNHIIFLMITFQQFLFFNLLQTSVLVRVESPNLISCHRYFVCDNVGNILQITKFTMAAVLD